MTDRIVSLDEALALVIDLTALDKVRLLERLAVMLEHDMADRPTTPMQGAMSPVASPIDSIPARQTPVELVAWLDANPPVMPWGNLADDQDVVEALRQKRQRESPWHEESTESL